MAKVTTTPSDFLKDETVIVQYIPNFKNGVTDPNNPLYGGLSNKATIGISAPLLTNKIGKIFTQEELQVLGEALGEDLGPRAPFWKEMRVDENNMRVGIFPIFLGKSGDLLNKKNPEDYIKIRILENSNIVATSPEDAKNRSTEVRFMLINKKDIHKEELQSINYKREANRLYGKIEDKAEVLSYVIRQNGKAVSDNQTLEFLQTEVYKILERDPRFFVSVVSDPLLNTKILLKEYIRYNLVQVNKDLYYDLEGNKLSLDGKVNSFDNAAEFLDSGLGSETKLVLDAKLKQAKK